MHFKTQFLLVTESIYHICRAIFFVTETEMLFIEIDSTVETLFAYIYNASKFTNSNKSNLF